MQCVKTRDFYAYLRISMLNDAILHMFLRIFMLFYTDLHVLLRINSMIYNSHFRTILAFVRVFACICAI